MSLRNVWDFLKILGLSFLPGPFWLFMPGSCVGYVFLAVAGLAEWGVVYAVWRFAGVDVALILALPLLILWAISAFTIWWDM